LIGQTVEILVEGPSKNSRKANGEDGASGPVQLTGRTMTDHIVVFEGNERLAGQTVSVIVEEATSFTLFGTVLTGEQIGVEADHDFPKSPETSPVITSSASQRIGLPVV